MYNEEYEDEEEEVKTSDNFLVNFYYNNKILVWILIGIILFILIMSLLTKGGSSGSKGGNSAYDVEILNPEEESVTISIGHTYTMFASIKDRPNAVFKWSVEDEKIAKVDNGTITGLAYGKTKVFATYTDDDNKEHQASKEVVVADGDPNTKLVSVSYKAGDLFMPVGSTYKIALTLNPPRGYVENETFSSSNTSVVQVDNTGLVTAMGEGEATISFDVNNGFFKKDLKVYVNNSYTKTEIIVTPERIEFDGELRKIKLGASERLTYTVTPETADRTKMDWKSSDETVATVDENGIVKGLKNGSTTITVTAINGASDKIDVEVGDSVTDVTDINLSTTDVSINVGQSQTIIPTVVPDSASNKALSFESLDSSIATVLGNGTGTSATITGVSVGYTTVVIRSTNGIEKRVNVSVNGNSGGGSYDDGGSSSGGSSSGSSSGSSNWSGRGYTISSKDSSGKNEGWVTSLHFEHGADNKATPPVTVTFTIKDSNVKKLNVKRCTYGSTCDPKTSSSNMITVTSSGSMTISASGDYVLAVAEYDASGKVVRTSENFILVGTGGSSSITCAAGQYYDTSAKKCLTCGGINGYNRSATGSVGKDKCYRLVAAGKSLTWTGSDTPLEKDCDDGYYSVERKVFYGHGSSCTQCTSGVSNKEHTKCESSPSTVCNPPTEVEIATTGVVSWKASASATSYEIKMSGGDYIKASGTKYNFKDQIVKATGSRAVYVRSVCGSGRSQEALATTSVYQVTVNKGTGISTVTSTNKYIKGTKVSLSATTTSDYKFTNWTTGTTVLSSSNPYSFEVNKNITITANAEKKVSGGGSSGTPSGGSSSSSSSGTLDPGFNVVEDASPTAKKRNGYGYMQYKFNSSAKYALGQVTVSVNNTSKANVQISKFNIFEYNRGYGDEIYCKTNDGTSITVTFKFQPNGTHTKYESITKTRKITCD